jgi:hypothetical protein
MMPVKDGGHEHAAAADTELAGCRAEWPVM